MKKIILMAFALCAMYSCTTQKLYSWSNYESTSYNYLKASNDQTSAELLKSYQEIINKQNGTRGVVPPGVYADYGFLLLQLNKTKEGKEMLMKEIELYPESKVFIDRILKKLEQ
ncbi:MAG: DUF4810 domain-containing protein [Paludibacter sp.]